MKKIFIAPFIVCLFFLISGCKDELKDTIFDQVFFEPYEGQDVRFLRLTIEPRSYDFATHCQLMTYSSEWPRGTFQLRYGLDNEFDTDTLLYTVNPFAPNETLVKTISYLIKRDEVFKSGNKVYFKPFYIIENGEICEGEEVVFKF